MQPRARAGRAGMEISDEGWLRSMEAAGPGRRAPPCARGEPSPLPELPARELLPLLPLLPHCIRAGFSWGPPAPPAPLRPGWLLMGTLHLGGEEQLGCSLGMVRWCQPCSQNWMGQGRAEEELGAFSFHTWETVKSQVATPAFVWYFQKNPAGPGIPGHNLLWKNKIIKYQSL